jgi:heme/copper-type cytochrome/quinol oxidase subunit 2
MRIKGNYFIVFLLIVQIVIPALIIDYNNQYNSNEENLIIIARTFENGNWYPENITVKVNIPITITFISEDVVHSFFIFELNINQKIYPGQPVTVTYIFDKVGIYSYMCHVVCSTDHLLMSGILLVKD